MKLRIILLAMISCAMVSCGASKKAVVSGDIEVITPCQGPGYQTDTNNFRESALGISKSQEVANQKAMTYARSKLATSVDVLVKRVAEVYVSSYEKDNTEESRSRYLSISREVVSQKLSGIRIICNKTMQNQEGQYKCYVTVELSSIDVLSAVKKRIEADSNLKTDFEYQKYLEVYNSEMEMFAKEQKSEIGN